MILQASGKSNTTDSEPTTASTLKDVQVEHQTTSPAREMNSAQHDGRASGLPVVQGITSCPCCNRRLDQGRQTLGEIVAPPVYDSLFQSDSYSDEEASTSDMDEQDSMMPGILADGDTYHVKKVLVQGWVYKKGTGMDWIGSRAWKARWACLVVRSDILNFFHLVHFDAAQVVFMCHDFLPNVDSNFVVFLMVAGQNRWLFSRCTTPNAIMAQRGSYTVHRDPTRFYCRLFRRCAKGKQNQLE